MKTRILSILLALNLVFGLSLVASQTTRRSRTLPLRRN